MADGSGSFSRAPGSWSSVQALAILFAAAFTVLVCLSVGKLVLRDACLDGGARFVVGAAVLALCAARVAYPAVLFGFGGAALIWGRGGLLRRTQAWKPALLFAPFLVL